MSLSDLASLGSFVSGVAVFLTLLFLGLQVRQADRNQKASLASEAIVRSNDFVLKLTDPNLADLYRRMIEGESDFTETEIIQLMNVLTGFLLGYEDVGIRRGMLLAEKMQAESFDNLVLWLLSLPVPRALWPLLRQNFSSNLRQDVDEIIRDTPVRKPPSFGSILKANLSKAGHLLVDEKSATA